MSSSGSKRPSASRKRRDAEFVRECEADEKVYLRVAKRRARLFPASKVAGGHSRRDHERDDEIFQAVIGSVRAGHAVCFGRGRQAVVSKAIAFFPELSEEEEDGRGRQKHTIWTPDWSHTGDRLKMLSFAQVMSVDGAMAFTANLAPAVVEQGLASPRGLIGYLTDRLVRELKRGGLNPQAWAFAIEASPLHDPHLHGLVGMGDEKTVRDALYRFGGFSGRRTGREVDLSPITDLEGWADYMLKAPLVTRSTLSYASKKIIGAGYTAGVIGASRSVRAAGKRWYQDRRSTGLPIT